MKKMMIVAAALATLSGSPALAWNDLFNSVWGPKGNDTGGIIPWSPENEAHAYEIALANCRTWNKYPVATSLHRMPGDYIAYRCVWDPPVVVRRHRHYHRVDVIIDK